MSASLPTDNLELTPQRCMQLLVERRRMWIIPTVVCAVLAVIYALFMTRYWEAFQGMVVRDEASVSSSKQPGKFADLYEMRTFQETILELAKSQHVVSTTIKNVAQAETGQTPPEPDAEQIEKFRKRLTMSPPDGAEFGKTEIFYFSVKDPSRERAIQLVGELCKQLAIRLGQLRQERSLGLVSELDKQLQLANEAYQTENTRLKEFESQVGADLGELRLLHSGTGGQSDLRQQMIDLEKESRVAEARLAEAGDLLVVLQAAQDNPEQLVAMPGSLLKIQPTLQRLKNGLVDAQLQASKLSSTRTPDHPNVRATLEAVERIRAELHQELAVVIEGLQVEIGLSYNRLEVLNSQIADLQKRLSNLAESRAEYSSRVASVENSRLVLNQSRKQLSEVRAKQVAALTAHLVTPIDTPETGPYPVGMGRTMVVILGTFAGLVLGVGWLFLNLPAGQYSASAQETTAPLIQPATAARPVPKPAESGFDFSSYTKKLREGAAQPTATIPTAKPVGATTPVDSPVIGLPLTDSALTFKSSAPLT